MLPTLNNAIGSQSRGLSRDKMPYVVMNLGTHQRPQTSRKTEPRNMMRASAIKPVPAFAPARLRL